METAVMAASAARLYRCGHVERWRAILRMARCTFLHVLLSACGMWLRSETGTILSRSVVSCTRFFLLRRSIFGPSDRVFPVAISERNTFVRAFGPW